MELFHVIEDATVIVRRKAVFKQCKVYRRGNYLYVGASGGFIRLHANHASGDANLSWDDIDLPGLDGRPVPADQMGRLTMPSELRTIAST